MIMYMNNYINNMILFNINSWRRLSVLWTTAVQRDGLVVALGVHVVVVLTRTTFVNDEDAVVDVEVDRCIDEISASNLS
jgi:hypothetical protein